MLVTIPTVCSQVMRSYFQTFLPSMFPASARMTSITVRLHVVCQCLLSANEGRCSFAQTTLNKSFWYSFIRQLSYAALAKINSGVTDPAQIFAQGHEQVVDAWKAF
jgi:hypothetical protein